MHLVPAHGLPRRKLDPGDFAQCLFLSEDRLDIEQTKTLRFTGRSLDAGGIGDAPTEHLIAGAEAGHATAASEVSEHVDVPALHAQGGEISKSRFRARQHHDIS